MVLSVFALEDETNRSCPSTGVTFEQCITQYGGYQPEETTCASKASLGEEYQRCLALAYYNLLQCFNHCPNHPRKSSYESYFQSYKDYYTPVVGPTDIPNAVPTGSVNAGTGTTGASGTTQNIDLNVSENDGSTSIKVFSLSTILCIIAYLLF
jgi:hypothetical protein